MQILLKTVQLVQPIAGFVLPVVTVLATVSKHAPLVLPIAVLANPFVVTVFALRTKVALIVPTIAAPACLPAETVFAKVLPKHANHAREIAVFVLHHAVTVIATYQKHVLLDHPI